MFVYTSNEMDNPNLARWQVLHDFRAVRSWAKAGHLPSTGIVGCHQEVSPEDKPVLREAFPTPWRITNLTSGVPHVLSARLEVLEADVHLMQHGIEGFSPNRVTTRTLVRLKQRPDLRGRPFTILGKWPVNGAFTTPGQDREALRREWWHQDRVKTARLIQAELAEGHSCIVLGDLNHPDPPRYVPGLRWVANHHLDHVGIVNAAHGVAFKAIGRQRVLATRKGGGPLYTDHAALGRDLRVSL